MDVTQDYDPMEVVEQTNIGKTGCDDDGTKESGEVTHVASDAVSAPVKQTKDMSTDPPEMTRHERHVSETSTQTADGAAIVTGVAGTLDVTKRERHASDTSTQTADGAAIVTGDAGQIEKLFEGVDASVVQKVAEYLQGGISPQTRSRTSSTCTDTSDLHGDGSEKSDGTAMKSPQSGKVGSDKLKTPGTSKKRRRKSGEQTPVNNPKSPQEIQNILKSYSQILLKSAQKQKKREEMGLSQSQMSVLDGSQAGGSVISRQLSTQSLPDNASPGKSSQPSTPVLQRTMSTQSSKWMSAVKPHSQANVTLKTQQSANIVNKANTNSLPSSSAKPDAVSVHNIETNDEIIESLHQEQEKTFTGVNISHHELVNIGTPIIQESSKPVGVENENFPSVLKRSQNTPSKVNIKETNTLKSSETSLQESSSKQHVIKEVTNKHSSSSKKKKLISAEKRNKRRVQDTGSPQPTGTFLSGTQRFKPITRGDPYNFHSSQSQTSPEQVSHSHEFIKF